MTTTLAPQIFSAERLNGGVIITFDDGKCALYSAALLYSVFSQAREIPEPGPDEL